MYKLYFRETEIEHGLTSPQTQNTLYRRRFLLTIANRPSSIGI